LNDECVIETKEAWAAFDADVILRDIDLCVRRSEVVALVGGSGSGKTTLLRLVLGLDRPLKGSIRLFGRALDECTTRDRERIRNRCGVVFQAGALFSALSAYDNVALPLRELKLLPEDVIRRLVMRKLALVEIDPASASKMPAELSGGMVKRVALARAIALDPELLFLDEPTGGLDPQRAHDFVMLIESLRQELGLTVLMATHDVETVIALADRVAVLAEQRLVAIGSLPDIVTNPHPFVRSFFLDHESQCEQTALRDYRTKLAQTRQNAAGR
jgi:phospholipid/cholesterol/gamma-HCH transport system ATP-binding protein